MFIIENKRFVIKLTDNAQRLSVTDNVSRTTLESHNPFQLTYGGFYHYNIAEHAVPKIENNGEKLTIYFKHFDFWARFKGHGYRKPDPGPDLRFGFEIILKENEVVFATETPEGLDEEICSVSFPGAFLGWDTEQKGEFVLPVGYGSVFDFPQKAESVFEWSGLALPIWGYFSSRNGFGVYVNSLCDFYWKFDINRTSKGRAFGTPVFDFEKKFSEYRRELTLTFFIKGANYNDLAKWYLNIVKLEGRFVSLRRKIEDSPEVEKLVGAVIWKHNVYSTTELPKEVHRDYSLYITSREQAVIEGKPENRSAYELFETAHKRGFDRLCIYNTGWNNMGFDSGYPTRFPVNPERGSEEDFKTAAEYARSLSDGFIYSVHDNYLDSYRNSPEFSFDEMIHDNGGAPRKGGIWRGGRCYLMCGTPAIKYAERDLPHIAEMTGKGSIYIDVIGCVPFHTCYSPEHPQSERQHMENRRIVMKIAKRNFGSFATENAPADFCADIVDLGAYAPFTRKLVDLPGSRPIPLWQLVYHDSVLGYAGEGHCGFCGRDYLAMCALYGLLPTQFDDTSKKLSFELREAYKAEMLSHEFLTQVEIFLSKGGSCHLSGAQKTEFSNGTIVIANFNDAPFSYKGYEVEGHDFIILNQEDFSK